MPTTIPTKIYSLKQLNRRYGLKKEYPEEWEDDPLVSQREGLESWLLNKVQLDRPTCYLPASNETLKNNMESISLFLGFCRCFLRVSGSV